MLGVIEPLQVNVSLDPTTGVVLGVWVRPVHAIVAVVVVDGEGDGDVSGSQHGGLKTPSSHCPLLLVPGGQVSVSPGGLPPSFGSQYVSSLPCTQT